MLARAASVRSQTQPHPQPLKPNSNANPRRQQQPQPPSAAPKPDLQPAHPISQTPTPNSNCNHKPKLKPFSLTPKPKSNPNVQLPNPIPYLQPEPQHPHPIVQAYGPSIGDMFPNSRTLALRFMPTGPHRLCSEPVAKPQDVRPRIPATKLGASRETCASVRVSYEGLRRHSRYSACCWQPSLGVYVGLCSLCF